MVPLRSKLVVLSRRNTKEALTLVSRRALLSAQSCKKNAMLQQAAVLKFRSKARDREK